MDYRSADLRLLADHEVIALNAVADELALEKQFAFEFHRASDFHVVGHFAGAYGHWFGRRHGVLKTGESGPSAGR